jgi:molybdopterin synthase sulfur carrier subunit
VREAVVKILFYGRLAEAIAPELEIDMTAECRVVELRERLAAGHPQAADTLVSGRSRACIDNRLVPEDQVIQPDDTIEFLPPVSGG